MQAAGGFCGDRYLGLNRLQTEMNQENCRPNQEQQPKGVTWEHKQPLALPGVCDAMHPVFSGHPSGFSFSSLNSSCRNTHAMPCHAMCAWRWCPDSMCLWWSGGDVERIREERKNEAEKQAASFAGTWNFKRGHLKRSSRQGVPSPANCIATVDGHSVDILATLLVRLPVWSAPPHGHGRWNLVTSSFFWAI